MTCTCYSALLTVCWLLRSANEKIKRENVFVLCKFYAGYAAIVFVVTEKRENLRFCAIFFEAKIHYQDIPFLECTEYILLIVWDEFLRCLWPVSLKHYCCMKPARTIVAHWLAKNDWNCNVIGVKMWRHRKTISETAYVEMVLLCVKGLIGTFVIRRVLNASQAARSSYLQQLLLPLLTSYVNA